MSPSLLPQAHSNQNSLLLLHTCSGLQEVPHNVRTNSSSLTKMRLLCLCYHFQCFCKISFFQGLTQAQQRQSKDSYLRQATLQPISQRSLALWQAHGSPCQGKISQDFSIPILQNATQNTERSIPEPSAHFNTNALLEQ